MPGADRGDNAVTHLILRANGDPLVATSPVSRSSSAPPNAFLTRCDAAFWSTTTQFFSSAYLAFVYFLPFTGHPGGFDVRSSHPSSSDPPSRSRVSSISGTSWTLFFSSQRPTRSTASSLDRWSHKPSLAMIRKSLFSTSILVVVMTGSAVK